MESQVSVGGQSQNFLPVLVKIVFTWEYKSWCSSRKTSTHPCIGVVDKEVQLASLLLPDPVEQLLHLEYIFFFSKK